MNRRFIKKPIEIEAFCFGVDIFPDWFIENENYTPSPCGEGVYIHTLEGDMKANDGDFIIKGVQGEIYPYKSDIFWQSYEEVHSNYVVKVSDCKSFDPKLWNNNGTIIPVIDNE